MLFILETWLSWYNFNFGLLEVSTCAIVYRQIVSDQRQKDGVLFSIGTGAKN